MKRILAAIIAILFFLFLFTALLKAPLPGDYENSRYDYTSQPGGNTADESVPEHYIKSTERETGSQNAVTAIVVIYRGFDTLGEVTVLFTAATGVSFLLSRALKGRKDERKKEANFVASTGVSFVLPFILLVGTYIFIHGHLTPGGGFPGGAVIATGFVLLLLTYPSLYLKEDKTSITESLSGLTYALIGFTSLVLGLAFLQNYLPKGTPGELLSAGIIPLIYIAIGFKVGSELSAILNHLKGGEEQ